MRDNLASDDLRRFKPYAEYKHFGVEWLSAIPSYWRVKPLKYSAVMNPEVLPEETNPNCSFEYLDISRVDSLGKVGQAEIVRFETAPSRARRRVRLGDTIISTVRTYLKAIALIEEAGEELIVSTGFSVLRPSDEVEPGFLWRAVQSDFFVQMVVAYSEGIGYPAINPSRLGRIPVIIPPRIEQAAIVDFLDRETAKIDALVAKKERLIQLLQEKRTAIITHAVTKGLNPNAPMKHSGVGSLGETPRDWHLVPLMRLTPDDRSIMYGIVLPGPNVPGGVPIVKGGDVEPGRLRLDALSRTAPDIEAGYVRSRLKGGDIVYAIRGSIGSAEIVPSELEGANLTQDAARVSPLPWINVQWLLFTLQSKAVFAQLEARSTGATIRGINIRDLKRTMIPLPPRALQDGIAAYLSRKSSQIDSVIGKIGQGIERLREYRTALISAAVTGKIDVRDLKN